MKIGLIVGILLAVFVNTVFGYSCGLGRYACVASCIGQNCATGYCVGPGPPETQICTCSRCDVGPIKPVPIPIPIPKK